jgi:hypothetical protein
VPVTLDGRAPDATGMALVWWVYPLSPQPPRYFRDGGSDDQNGG